MTETLLIDHQPTNSLDELKDSSFAMKFTDPVNTRILNTMPLANSCIYAHIGEFLLTGVISVPKSIHSPYMDYCNYFN